MAAACPGSPPPRPLTPSVTLRMKDSDLAVALALINAHPQRSARKPAPPVLPAFGPGSRRGSQPLGVCRGQTPRPPGASAQTPRYLSPSLVQLLAQSFWLGRATPFQPQPRGSWGSGHRMKHLSRNPQSLGLTPTLNSGSGSEMSGAVGMEAEA